METRTVPDSIYYISKLETYLSYPLLFSEQKHPYAKLVITKIQVILNENQRAN